MNSLLQYTLYQFTWFILWIEFFVMLFACLAITLVKAFTNWKKARNENIQNYLSALIDRYLVSNEKVDSLQIPSNYSQFRNIVEVLEKYDHRFSDPSWQAIKTKIVITYLIPRATKMAHSLNWANRQLAARAYYLLPEAAPEELLKLLLDDNKYLVRVIAAVTIVKINNKKLFFEMINQMSKEYVISRFSYRDALIDASSEKFLWLEELLASEPEAPIASIALDVLSTRLSHNLLPIIKKYVTNPNSLCRLLAIKALGNIPSHEAVTILQQHLNDSSWEIRVESICGLSRLYVCEAAEKISDLINDSIWFVRLQAALALKNFGEKGIKILKEKAKSDQALEISRYVLSLPQDAPTSFVAN